MTTLFISDLHLSTEHPEITQCFLTFLKEEALYADALYILGDLFESWIGDDDITPLHEDVKKGLKTLTEKGVPVYFIHGNRDFLIGKRFVRETGVKLLPEHYVVDLYGKPVLLMHGDTLCTQDLAYQQYRQKVHNSVIQWLYLRLPLRIRRKIGERLRAGSKSHNAEKSEMIMDVEQKTVMNVMAEENVDLLIHGHTHRPNIHQLIVDKKPAQRIVLGDWYEQGSVLVYKADSIELQQRRFGK
ncbi:UDP-2,3-diacylglucosamine diphosphatase [Veronia nyctiphanis]|uniref:UDP-2,3-diacylglucosamine hydrolase n=1 Tax=Veronia nyctiphanis TaxID=1278244 RepID=A0A4Q0Z081_9GAMM|nr:UDP-2,3-diacylglucosamine diphosphatase [Veronia nyctiphanis]RXJ74829.1 UDP-2,3-diacylglucosamine diphosphatase [Veronia nyctiphanis]